MAANNIISVSKCVISADSPSGTLRCNFYIEKKRRRCNLVARASTGFCGEHSGGHCDCDQNYCGHRTDGQYRLKCPIDPKHTCWSHKLEKHVKVCRKRMEALRSLQPVYYIENINSGKLDGDDTEEELAKITANNVELEEVIALLERVERLHDVYCQPVEDGILLHPSMERVVLEASRTGNKSLKHARQEASILGNLKESDLLTTEAVYVEFGAGNGHLTYWLAKELGKQAVILAVDRQTVRHKFDRRQDFEEKDCVTRLKIDIEHLDLDSVPQLSALDRPVIAYSKHLCGSATDLCLRCVCSTLQTNLNKKTKRLHGLVIALCCHHRGNWRHYVGKSFFHELGLTPRDYHIIQSLTSWATCAFHQKSESNRATSTTNASKSGWSVARREEIGLKCKRLLDAGRIDYLGQNGYRTRLIRYVEADVSRENILMLVTPRDACEL